MIRQFVQLIEKIELSVVNLQAQAFGSVKDHGGHKTCIQNDFQLCAEKIQVDVSKRRLNKRVNVLTKNLIVV